MAVNGDAHLPTRVVQLWLAGFAALHLLMFLETRRLRGVALFLCQMVCLPPSTVVVKRYVATFRTLLDAKKNVFFSFKSCQLVQFRIFSTLVQVLEVNKYRVKTRDQRHMLCRPSFSGKARPTPRPGCDCCGTRRSSGWCWSLTPRCFSRHLCAARCLSAGHPRA